MPAPMSMAMRTRVRLLSSRRSWSFCSRSSRLPFAQNADTRQNGCAQPTTTVNRRPPHVIGAS
jgi:hypothetical protein